MLLCIVVCFQAVAMGADFNSIVRGNTDNPAKIVEELRKIRDHSEEADVFLHNFGGKNFWEEDEQPKEYFLDATVSVKIAAWNIGMKLFKREEKSLSDDMTSLLAARRFLRFASDLSPIVDEDMPSSEIGQIDGERAVLHCVDRDISPFCTIYILEETIKWRRKCISERQAWLRKLKEKKERRDREGRELTKYPQELLDEL